MVADKARFRPSRSFPRNFPGIFPGISRGFSHGFPAVRRRNSALSDKYQKLMDARWHAWRQSPEAAENRLKALRLRIEEGGQRAGAQRDQLDLPERSSAAERVGATDHEVRGER